MSARLAQLGHLTALIALGLSLPGCSSDDHPPPAPGAGSGAPGAGGNATGSGGATVVVVGGTTGNQGSGGGLSGACVGEVTTGEPVPLDMFIMLDLSGSMLDSTASGQQKWEAVRSAVVAFLEDDRSAGLGVGIQYFPLQKPGTPETCSNDAQCGDSGPCLTQICWGEDAIIPCETNDDCGGLLSDGECVTFGECENDRTWVCRPIGGTCGVDQGVDLGDCIAPQSECLNATLCDVDAYATPAVPIATLPGAAAALVASINGQDPTGRTPTGPALAGAVTHARDWAAQNPTHAVVVVMATDGLPTECTPLTIPNVAGIAAEGAALDPSIRTFVIGVFGPEDADAPGNLDAIAEAGDTDSAYIVDTGGDVSQQFYDALDEIRSTGLSCEFRIPEPQTGDKLDYGYVNVEFTDSSGTTTRLLKVSDESACDPSMGGWYYDDEAAPSRIVVCPSSCTTLETSAGGSVQIQLGCITEVP